MATRTLTTQGVLVLTVLALGWAWLWMLGNSPVQGAATLTVTTTGDSNSCGTPCSLRGAIAVASSGDTINIPAGIYTLTLGTELAIDKNLTLTGAGSGNTIIQAATSSADATSRVFNITGGNVAISGATIRNGNASGSGTAGRGGGISNIGTLTLNSSTVNGNAGSNGGAIFNRGTADLTNSTVSGNTAGGPSRAGGGINNNPGGFLTLNNSTVSGNTAEFGGGIINSETLTLTNSIIASSSGDDCYGIVTSFGHNLDSDGTCSLSVASGDLPNTDPLLGPLQNNGGPTFTHALLPGSPAIDSGDDSVLGPPHNLTTDQRGKPRLQGAHVDIGAYEYSPPKVLLVTKTGDTNDGLCGDISYSLPLPPSVLPTGNSVGDPDCSLREAIAAAASGDRIAVPVGIYTVSLGQLAISRSVTVDGSGPPDTIIQAHAQPYVATHRVFNIGGNNVVISNVTIRHGNTPFRAGGIVFHGTETLPPVGGVNSVASIITDGTAASSGGFVNDDRGTLTIMNSVVSDNTAGIAAGAIDNSFGTVRLINSTVSGNTTSGDGGGIYNSFATLTLTNSTVSGNSASFGGGIWNQGTLTLTNSIVSSNTGDKNGGGIFNNGTLNLTNSAVRSNASNISGNETTTFFGGGIVNNGIATLTNTTVTGNTSTTAGGIWNSPTGTLTLDNSVVSNNTATSAAFTNGSGGGIQNIGTGLIRNSLISGNTAGPGHSGGGIFNCGACYGGSASPVLSVLNSTVTGNSACCGGGIHNNGGGTVTLANSTITDNTANGGGGILNDQSTVEMTNTIVANSPSGGDCAGSITSLGHNLIGTSDGCSFTPSTGDLVNGDPLLGPLQDNGGPTFTHALLRGSPAIDAGDDAVLGPPHNLTTDQRGMPRLQGAHVDIGAYEACGLPAGLVAVGWTLIGWACESPGDPAAIATGLGGTVRIYGYDPAVPANPWKIYDSAAPPFVNTLLALTKWSGYWVLYEPGPIEPPPGMVGWWPGDGNAFDFVGGNHGTLTGDFARGKVGQGFIAQGILGRGFSLDGTGDYVLIPDNPSLDIRADVSVDLWAKRAALGGSPTRYLLAKGAGGIAGVDEPSAYFMFFDNSDGRLIAGFERANASNVQLAGPSVTDSDFHNYAYVRSSDTHRLYVDGEFVTGDNFIGSPGHTSGLPLTIGALRNDPSPTGFVGYFGGVIDEVEIFNRALSAAEVKAIYDAGSAGKKKPPALAGIVTIRDSDEANFSDKLSDEATIYIPNAPYLPADKNYEGWFVSDNGPVSVGVLVPDVNGTINHKASLMSGGAPTGENNFARHHTFMVTLEPLPDPDPAPTNEVAYSHTIPAGAFVHIVHLVFSWAPSPAYTTGFHAGTPKGIIVGLREQTSNASLHAQLSADSSTLLLVKTHACHVVNIVEGIDGPNFDAFCGNPGDGFGVLSYADDAFKHASFAAGAAPEDPARKPGE